MPRPPVSLHGGHTTVFDGSSGPAEIVDAALASGMEVYGLSEHFYRPRDERFRYPGEDPAGDFGRAGWPRHAEQMAVLAARAAPALRLLLGAEVEYLEGYRDWTVRELERWPIDYVVLSVHFLRHEDEIVTFDFSAEGWRRAAELFGGEVGLYCSYYDHVLDALDWGVADVLGHLDVIKIFAPRPVTDPEIDLRVDRILGRCRDLGVVLDLNARGLLKPCREVYPSRALLERALTAGVGIVPGDDAHAPGEVGLGLDRAVEHARLAGYREVRLPARLGGLRWPI